MLQGRKLSVVKSSESHKQKLLASRSTMFLGGQRVTKPEESKKLLINQSLPKLVKLPSLQGINSPQSSKIPPLSMKRPTQYGAESPDRSSLSYFSAIRKSNLFGKLQPLSSNPSQFDDSGLTVPNTELKTPKLITKTLSTPQASQLSISKYMPSQPSLINEQDEIDHEVKPPHSKDANSSQYSNNSVGDLPDSYEINPFIQKFKQRESVASNYTQGSDQSENDEDYDVWDNQKDVRVVAALTDQTPDISEIQNFLKFYKMRFGGFPGLPEHISNEKVIETAVQFAGQNKRLFRKYFPNRQVEFDDNNDYSEPYDQDKDANFHEFRKFCANLTRRTDSPKQARRIAQGTVIKESNFKRKFVRPNRVRQPTGLIAVSGSQSNLPSQSVIPNENQQPSIVALGAMPSIKQLPSLRTIDEGQ